MAKFLLTVWPFPTHLHPNLALAHALKKHSHEVAFFTAPGAAPLIEGEGFRCFPFRELDWDHVDWVVSSIISPSSRFGAEKLWLKFLVETVPAQLRDLETPLREWCPDALVCDIAMWAPILVLHEARGLPVAVFSHMSGCMLTGPQGPIPGISLRRPHNALTRFRARLLSKAAELVIQSLQGSASRLRQAHGLPATRMTFTEFSGTMPLYLVPSAPEFDYQRQDLPASVHYVGPCLWDKPASQPPPPWIRELGRNGPRVLVTEGTLYTTDPTVLRVAAEGLANLPASVLLIAGKTRPTSGLGPKSLPRNMTAPGWAPLSDLLPLADLVVCNGNSETVLAALSRGLPLIVVPSIWEQSETGWRVVDSGAGLSLPAHRCTPARLRAAVERVLHEPSFRRNAERLAAVFARYGEANHAVRLLAGLVSERVTR